MIKSRVRIIIAILLCILLAAGCTNKAGSGSNKDTSLSGDTITNNDTSSASANSDISQSQASSGAEDAGNNSSTDTTGDISDASVQETVSIINAEFDTDDYYNSVLPEEATTITLEDNSASISGSGASAEGNDIIISSEGVYIVSGSLKDGQLLVSAGDKADVQIILNGASIHCSDSAPIYIQSADKVVLSLQAGTENSLTDTADYVLADSNNDEPNAALFSKSDLIINGAGTLTIDANYNNAIASKDDLKITEANLSITSVDDGIIGKDMLAVKDAFLTVNAGGDGLKSTNEADSTKGYLFLSGGAIDITAGTDGIQAVTSVIVTDTDLKVVTGGGSSNASIKTNGQANNSWGKWGNKNTSNDSEASTSAKGIKCNNTITISGGTVNIDSSDDSIRSNNLITIAGGDINLASGDDGIHADAEIQIDGGTINITKSYEGIESVLVTIDNGDIQLVSSDDGINIAGGTDASSTNGRAGQNMFDQQASYGDSLDINGGSIYVNAGGDGLDSNGSINITGGTILVNGPTDDGNGPIDYGESCNVTGGYLVAAGSSGMAEAPSDTSTQNSISVLFSDSQAAGSLVHIEDSQGNDIATFAPAKQYECLIISSPGIKQGETYTISTGGSMTGSQTGGLYTGGDYKNGSQMVQFTVSDVVTWVDKDGITQYSGGFGPMGGGFGGGRNGRRP